MNIKKQVESTIEKKFDLIEKVNTEIWHLAELAFEESESVKLYIDLFEKEGFEIEKNLTGIPTAFKATYGSGSPTIAILGEYDALPNLSQEAGKDEFSPIKKGEPGHGCGHNSLGAASFGATLAVKEYLEKNDIDGTIEFYGCPAEEDGNAKTFLVRDGAFDNVDLAFTWHPGDLNTAWSAGSLANITVNFHFKGTTAHAAATPHLGRSALDTAELMNIGVNYLREHIIPEARVHYAYLDVGGEAPNVVQDTASLYYFIRAPKMYQAQEIYERVINIAKGAALMSDTEVEIEFKTGLSDFIPNEPLTKLLQEAMEEIGAPKFTDTEYKIASKFFDTLTESEQKKIFSEVVPHGTSFEDFSKRPLHNEIIPLKMYPFAVPGSTDVGDVSYVVPTAQLTMATVALGTPSHTWQMTAQGNTTIALKGVEAAAKSMALASIKAIENPSIVDEAKKALEIDTGGEYICPVPEHIKPNIK